MFSMNLRRRRAWIGGLAMGLLSASVSAQTATEPLASAAAAKDSKDEAPAQKAGNDASQPSAPTASESQAAAASPTGDNEAVSPFRAVAEKAAALSPADAKGQPPHRERSLFEMSQGTFMPSTRTVGVDSRPEEPELPPATLDNLGNLQTHWQLFMHFRGSWVADRSFDPFADDDFLPGVGVGGGRVLFSDGQLSLAAQVFIEGGATESAVRGETSNLSVARLGIGPELRYHVIPRSYAFIRALPAVLRAEASLEDPVTASTLDDTQFAFATDLGAGVAFNAAGDASGAGHKPRFWVIAEGGYGLAFLRDLELDPQEGDPAPARVEPLRWPAPSLDGPFMRLSVALTL